MTIEFHCPHCGKSLSTSDDKAGRTAKCPGCQEPVTVPGAVAAAVGGDVSDEPAAGADGLPAMPPRTERPRGVTCKMCGADVPPGQESCPECGEPVTFEQDKPDLTGGHRFEVGVVISEAWEAFKRQPWTAIGLVLVWIVLNQLSQIPMQAVQIGMGAAQGDEMTVLLVAFWIAYVFSICVQLFLSVGLNMSFLKMARGQESSIADLFGGGRRFLSMLGNTIVFGLVVGVGFAALIVPGIFLMAALWPYYLIVADRDVRGLEPMTIAYRLTKGNRLNSIALGFISFFIVLAGLIALCVGMLVALPVVYLMFTMAYLYMTGERSQTAGHGYEAA